MEKVYDLTANKHSNVTSDPPGHLGRHTKADNTLLFALSWMLVSRLIWFAIPKFMSEFYSSNIFQGWQLLSAVIWIVITVLLASLVRDKTWRPILFVIVVVLGVNSLYGALEPFLSPLF